MREMLRTVGLSHKKKCEKNTDKWIKGKNTKPYQSKVCCNFVLKEKVDK